MAVLRLLVLRSETCFNRAEETLQTGFIVGGETVKSFVQASDGDFPVMVGMTQSFGTASVVLDFLWD